MTHANQAGQTSISGLDLRLFLPGYSFFSAGAAAAGGGAAGLTVAVTGAVFVFATGAGVAVSDERFVSMTGASCQWPCSTDQTLPGGAWPGG